MDIEIINVSEKIESGELPCCPLCDNEILEMEPCVIVAAHGAEALAHSFCVLDEKDEEKLSGEINWDVRPGTLWARCSCTDPPRKLKNDEVKVTFFHESGNVRNAGSAKCKECGATISWHTR